MEPLFHLGERLRLPYYDGYSMVFWTRDIYGFGSLNLFAGLVAEADHREVVLKN